MSFFSSSDIISFFTERAQEYAALARTAAVTAAAKATAAANNAAAQATDYAATDGSRSFVLELIVNGAVSQTLTFDVSLYATDGFAQRVAYQFASRESTHHTASGYFNEQYGIAVGQFSIDAEVTFRDNNGAAQVQSFFSIFANAKSTSPLVAPNPPPVVLLHDVFLGQSFTVSQTALSVEQNVDMLNRARIGLSGVIFGLSASSATAPTSFSDAASTTNDYAGSLTDSPMSVTS